MRTKALLAESPFFSAVELASASIASAGGSAVTVSSTAEVAVSQMKRGPDDVRVINVATMRQM